MSTIFALSSGSLPAAIAVFRVSGRKSLKILKTLSGKDTWKPREMRYTVLKNKEGIIDRAMAVYLPGPNTFTGEDTTEIFVHGSVAVARQLAATLAKFDDVREATRGEFTRRAFHNGKMDLSEVHGLGDLLQARTETQRRLAFGKMRGGERAVAIRNRLKNLVAQLYLLIDFGEHVAVKIDDVKQEVYEIISEMSALLSAWQRAEKIQRGLSIVLYGRPNTGKSSIMNGLAQDDVAIVSHLPGTTRDSILTTIELAGVPCRLTDTAGIRSSSDVVEEEGIRRARSKLSAADIVLIVVDNETSRQELDKLREDVKTATNPETKVFVVRNKSDLGGHLPDEFIPSSTLTSSGLFRLQETLEDAVSEMCPETTHLLDDKVLQKAIFSLSETLPMSDAALICTRVEAAVQIFGELTANVAAEDVLDHIFASFCIGK